eukprot:1696484-Alexandrium_andersonii.AAC.1
MCFDAAAGRVAFPQACGPSLPLSVAAVAGSHLVVSSAALRRHRLHLQLAAPCRAVTVAVLPPLPRAVVDHFPYCMAMPSCVLAHFSMSRARVSFRPHRGVFDKLNTVGVVSCLAAPCAG